MGRARWVRVGRPKILEGWAQKMKARKKSGLFGPVQIGPRANWVRVGLAHMACFFLYYYFFYHINRIF